MVALLISLPFSIKISNALILVGTSLALLKLYSGGKLSLLNLDPLSKILLCYFVVEIMGLTYTETSNFNYGMQILEKHIGFVFIPICFLNFTVTSKLRNYFLWSFIITCLVATMICIAGSIKASLTVYNQFYNDWMFSHDRFAEYIGLQPVYFALYLSFASLIIVDSLLYGWNKFSKLKTWLLAILFIYFLAVIINLGGRTVIISLMAIIIFLIFSQAYQKKSFKMLWIASLIPIIFASFVFLQPTIRIRFMDMLKSNYSETNYGSYFARLNIWIPGIEVIKENFWLGVGTGDSQAELDKKFLKYNYLEGVRIFNMHNQYLQTFLSHGVIGFFLLLLCFLVQIKDGYQKGNLLYFSFIFLFMGACLTESMLNRNKGIIFFLIFSFIFFKAEAASKKEIGDSTV